MVRATHGAYPKDDGNHRRQKQRGKALTDTEIKTAKPREKPFKLSDGRGLYLLVTPAGAKLWRFKYQFSGGRGREKLLAFGAYPDVSLADARDKREEARQLIARGVNPATQRRIERNAAAFTFEVVAREWFEKNRSKWTAGHARTILSRLEQNAFPYLGSKPINEITAPEMLDVLLRIDARGANETTRRVKQICSQVFSFAIAKGSATNDPTFRLERALAPVESTHLAAVTEPAKLAGLLRVIDGYTGSVVVRGALRLAPLVFVRPGELRHAEWSEIDLEAGRWLIPPWRMKMRKAHLVPLSRQAVAILRELQPISGHGRYVFPSARSMQRPMSNNAVLAAFRRSGIPPDEMTGHGFRAAARTILDEVLHVRVDLIEHQLAHAVKDPLGNAYNRTTFLAERIEMMQRWSDYLDDLKAGNIPEAAAARWAVR